MFKYDKRRLKKLSLFEKIVEWIRLMGVISKASKKINYLEKKTRGSLRAYRYSGLPVHKLRLDFDKKSLLNTQESIKGHFKKERAVEKKEGSKSVMIQVERKALKTKLKQKK